MPAEIKPGIRVLREPAVLDRLSVSRGTLRGLVKAGRLPRPIRLGPNSNGWLEHELDQAVLALSRERDDSAAG